MKKLCFNHLFCNLDSHYYQNIRNSLFSENNIKKKVSRFEKVRFDKVRFEKVRFEKVRFDKVSRFEC